MAVWTPLSSNYHGPRLLTSLVPRLAVLRMEGWWAGRPVRPRTLMSSSSFSPWAFCPIGQPLGPRSGLAALQLFSQMTAAAVATCLATWGSKHVKARCLVEPFGAGGHYL